MCVTFIDKQRKTQKWAQNHDFDAFLSQFCLQIVKKSLCNYMQKNGIAKHNISGLPPFANPFWLGPHCHLSS